jgi:hypothetical protein
MKSLFEKPVSKPRELSERELEQVSAGKLTTENPGGQQHGASQITTNDGGNEPPGQNKNLPPGLR